jgi:hypothetical protein
MAWYDITLEGFTVNQQTWDHGLNVDGWADEVFLHNDVRVVDQSGATLLASNTRTAVMGDANGFPNRVRAGTKTPRGGLQSGDAFPYPEPWVRKGGLRASAPPLRLWQGELTDERAVVIVPTVWEWDGGTDMFNAWGQEIVNHGPAIAQAVIDLIAIIKTGAPIPVGKLVRSTLELGLPPLFALSSSVLGQAKDRPIGMRKDGGNYAFNASVITLTASGAELATQTDFGKGPGVLVVGYSDDGSLGAGSYSLYVRVSRVNVPLDDGSLVREHSSPAVFVIYGGAKFWIPSPDWLARYTPRPATDVVVVPDRALAGIPQIPRDGTVLREWSDARVYVLLSGQRCWIPSFELLDKYTAGQRWSRVRVVPDGALAQVPQGPTAS